MKKLLLIINKNSGLKNSKAGLLDAVDVFCKNGYKVVAYITQRRKDAYEYIRKNKEKYDAVCVFGGDGTLNEITNGLMHKRNKMPIGYFPSGTMNDFGSNLELGNDFKEIAENICSDKIRGFDVGKCNDLYFNYVAAFGALCDVPYTTDRVAKERFGTLAYIFDGLTKLDTIKPIYCTVTVKNKKKKMKLLFGLVFSGGRVAGTQILGKKQSNIDDGLFNVLLVEYVESGLLIDFPDLFSVILKPNKYLHRYQTSEITFDFEDDVNWTLDGEEAKFDNHVNIKNINKALTIKA